MTQPQNFTAKTVLTPGDHVAGYASGGGSGSERRFDVDLFQKCEWQVDATSTTGGTGSLTLTDVTRRMNGDDYFTHGTLALVEYTITEWGSSSYKVERGYGTFTYSTKVLARTKPTITWDGSTLDNTAPSKISFASSGVTVKMTPAGADGHIPFFNVTTGDDLGMCSAHIQNSTGTLIGTVDVEWYTPFLWTGRGQIVQAGIYVTTGQAGGAAKLALYAVGVDGLPGERIKDFNSGAPFSCTASGAKTVAVTGLWLPPGWYYTGLIATASSTMPTFQSGSASGRISPAGTDSGANIQRFTKSGNYTTGLPSPASTSLSAVSSAMGAVVYLKAANT